ncbi:hypothetical protein [Streptomyces sp. DH37]|uniref:hypothetical protein n=1 Tax=Streptomyces sp. DH37 TaxID=3040122 RepID=UPI0024426DA1|nr:hypothetical protein [Streptomyces sp. DH37]MDG9702932.1 hypothetical protein [Streptomyces sp. DH37]
MRRAAPGAWVELSAGDAERLGVAEGDLVRVEPPGEPWKPRRGSAAVATGSCSRPSTTATGTSPAPTAPHLTGTRARRTS